MWVEFTHCVLLSPTATRTDERTYRDTERQKKQRGGKAEEMEQKESGETEQERGETKETE